MSDPIIDEIVDRALRFYQSRDHRVGMRSAFADAAGICDLVAKRVEAANQGRSKGSVSQIGQAIAHAIRRAGDEIMAVRDRIDAAPEPSITHAPDSPIHTGRMRKVPRFAVPIEEDGE